MAPPDDNLVTVGTVSTEMEGQLLVNLLEEQGIAAVGSGGFTSEFRAEAPGVVRVLVKQEDAAAAEAVIADRGQGRDSSEPPDVGGELPESPRSTQSGLWIVVGVDLIAIAGLLVAWAFGADVIASLVALVLFAAFMVFVVARRLGRQP